MYILRQIELKRKFCEKENTSLFETNIADSLYQQFLIFQNMNKISNILFRTLSTIEIALWKFNVPTFVGISQPLIFALKRIFIWRWSVFKGTTAWKVVSQSHEEGIWKFNFALIKYLASIKYLTSVNSEERENPPDAFDSPVAYLWEHF